MAISIANSRARPFLLSLSLLLLLCILASHLHPLGIPPGSCLISAWRCYAVQMQQRFYTVRLITCLFVTIKDMHIATRSGWWRYARNFPYESLRYAQILKGWQDWQVLFISASLYSLCSSGRGHIIYFWRSGDAKKKKSNHDSARLFILFCISTTI